jgi:small subunit ribosomal protein S6
MEQRIKTYEAMFLLDSGNPDFQAASEPVRNILLRYGAEILALKPWDDRRLIYDILGRKRGLYVLAYFKLDTARVSEVEHDCQLDERILRALVLRRDTLTEQEINAETPATSMANRVPEPTAAAAGEAAAVAPIGIEPAEEAAVPDVLEVPAEDEKT